MEIKSITEEEKLDIYNGCKNFQYKMEKIKSYPRLKPFDFLFFAMPVGGAKCKAHGAVYIGKNNMIHVDELRGVYIESTRQFRKHIHYMGRFENG